MPRQGRSQERRSKRQTLAALLIVLGAASLSACGGSSGNFVPLNAGGSTPGYNADGSVSASPSSITPAFAATGTTVHSNSASKAADTLTSVAKPGNSAYKIGPLDVLEIQVFKVPDLAKIVQVSENGEINYPLLGDVQAAGKTAHDLEHDLTQKLGVKYLRNPQVSVLVKEFNSQRVTVSGSVKTSGVYAIKGNMSLLQVVAMAGDVDAATYSGDVVIFRTINGQRSAARFDIDDVRAGKAADPPVEPGDVIVLDSSATKVAFHNLISALPLASAAVVFSGL